MTASAPTSPSSDRAPITDLATLAKQADDQLAELIPRLEARSRLALATAAHLARLETQQRECTDGPFAVFESEATHQIVVLRGGIVQLDGARLLQRADSYAAALQWTNDRLATLLAGQTVARFAEPAPPAQTNIPAP